MNRAKKLGLNATAALVYQFITIICGFVLPKFIIPYFGSEVNGLINSIMQFLSIIALCECGVGAVVQSALYKPLADKNDAEISRVIISSKRFFGNIMKILCIYVLCLVVIYPFLVKESFGFFYVASLIVIMAFSYIAQHYLFLPYKLLLNADQVSYIQLGAHCVTLIMNTLATVILTKLGGSIHMVRLASALAFLIQPFVVKSYVDRHYKINLRLTLDEEPIKQKWNGLAQHISAVVRQNIATVVLTLFAGLKDISIYSVYFLVVNGIKQIIFSLNTGVQAMLGNMYANKETETLQNTHATIVFAFHTLVTLMFTITGILLVPFVKVYTVNFTDADYVYPLFGVVMTLSQAAYCIRLPYEIMTQAAGHYKQTQASSIIEAVICAVVSVLCTLWWGLIGVAVGELIALLYRTVYLAIYLSKNILYRDIKYFIKHMFVDVLSAGLMVLATFWIKLASISYLSLIIMAFKVGFICLTICAVINVVFYRKMIGGTIKFFLKKK